MYASYDPREWLNIGTNSEQIFKISDRQHHNLILQTNICKK